MSSARRLRRLAAVAVVALGGVAAATGPATASAKGLPDLEVSTKAPATVALGKKVTITVALRNAGRAKAGATTTRISLGASTTRYVKGDKVLATVRQKAVGRGARTSAKVTFTIPAGAVAAKAPAGRGTTGKGTGKGNGTAKAKAHYILACADSRRRVRESGEGDNCTKVARVDGKAGGTVDGQSSPAAKPKPKPPVELPPIVAPTTPPPVTRDRDPARDCDVGPGTQVPLDIQNWESVLAPGAQARFWWPKSRPAMRSEAEALSREFDAVIFPRLTRLMGKTPLPDDATVCPHGADPKLDVYLVDVIGKPWHEPGGAMGTTIPFRCRKHEPTASSIYLARRTKETLAHELFHVLQFAYGFEAGCLLPGWIDEGTAEWAVEYVYPHALKEESSSLWLEEPKGGLMQLDYAAWPFWYDVVQRDQRKEQVIPELFRQLGTKLPVDAADAAVDHFINAWHPFARDAYDVAPIEDTFASAAWSASVKHPKVPVGPLLVGGNPITGSHELKPLTRGYDRYTIADPVRKITISDLPTSAPGVYKLHALVKLATGEWQELDVADHQTWCRDNPAEDIREIILVSSDASVSKDLTSDATITGEEHCGQLRYKVLSASFDTTTTGSMSAGQWCGSVHGSTDLGGHLAAPKADPSWTLKRDSAGNQDLNIGFETTVEGTRTYDGCKGIHKDPCHLTYPESMFSTRNYMSVHFRQDAGANVAKLIWNPHHASVGVIDVGDDSCNVFNFWNSVPTAQATRPIAAADLQRGTHTYTISESTSWTMDAQQDLPAQLTMGWSYTITIQVLDGGGVPIP